MKLLVHACCGPCSLEPHRWFVNAGCDVTLAYLNSNIHPWEENLRRLETLRAWA
ncbi:MAG: epoxyqueuosine reductase QueH, partial [Actinobacteria bacterium]|nr:epoxyqueuosine reductase QueH [Actinomycetota bacterium]